jgi:hypothetical protein
MALICRCPICLADVVGRFQRTCLVCGSEIAADLRMAGGLATPRAQAAGADASFPSRVRARTRSLAAFAAEPNRDSSAPNPFEDIESDEPLTADRARDMDWNDEPDRPSRWRWLRPRAGNAPAT